MDRKALYTNKLIREAERKNDYIEALKNNYKVCCNSPLNYVDGYIDGIIFALYEAKAFGDIPKAEYEKKINEIIDEYDKQFEFDDTVYHRGDVIKNNQGFIFLVIDSYGKIDRISKKKSELLSLLYTANDKTEEERKFELKFMNNDNTENSIIIDIDSFTSIKMDYKFIDSYKYMYNSIGKVDEDNLNLLLKAREDYNKKMSELYDSVIKK